MRELEKSKRTAENPKEFGRILEYEEIQENQKEFERIRTNSKESERLRENSKECEKIQQN